MADNGVSLTSVVVVDVDEMEENRGAVDVAQESVAEPLAFGGTFDEAGDVGDEQILVVDGGDAKIRGDGSEGVVGNFGLGVRNNGEEGGFAGVGQADKTNVSEEFEFEFSLEGFARFANFGDDRGLASARFEVSVTEAAVATFCDDCFFLVVSEVGDNLAVAFDDGADGNFDD